MSDKEIHIHVHIPDGEITVQDKAETSILLPSAQYVFDITDEALLRYKDYKWDVTRLVIKLAAESLWRT